MKIFIDCGHNFSGADTGAIGNGYREQDITYNVGKQLKELLMSVGFTVICSRNELTDSIGTTVNESLVKRSYMANSINADYFVSLHCDSASTNKAKGGHVCVYKKGTTAEKFANCISKYLPEGRSEKVQERDLAVLRQTKMPAILIEMGFISSTEDIKIITDYKGIAIKIFNGICDYFGINKATELTSVNDIVFELSALGIISDKELWLKKLEEDKNSYWLARKSLSYIKGVK